MKLLFIPLFIILSFSAAAQDLHLTAFGGFANYQGDLQDKRFTTKQSHGAFGGGLLYEINEHFGLRANVTFGTLSADDKLGINMVRNLNFTTKLTDYHLGVEYNFLDIYEYGFSPYLFTGLSIFQFNPYTADGAGKKVFLQPLGTEGQGFYQNRKKYRLNQLALPVGAGIKFALGDNIRLGVEAALRITGTDYLDDVSTTFVDKDDLLSQNGPQALALAFRGDELKEGFEYPNEGEKRGSPKSKDLYYFTGITLSYRFHKNENNGSQRNYRLNCPGGVR